MKVDFLFPTHVLVSDQIKRQDTNLVLTQQEEDYIDECCQNVRPSIHDHIKINNYHRITEEKYLLHHPSMKNLHDWIKDWANHHISNLYCTPDELSFEITQSWLTVCNDQYNLSFPHGHSNSFMAGVLYIQANREYDSIEFTRTPTGERFKMEVTDTSLKKTRKVTPLVIDSIRIPVHTGDILLFSSHTLHKLHTSPDSKEARISLAFNLFPTGSLGRYQNANHVKLQVG